MLAVRDGSNDARNALVLLFAISLFNYMDRFVLSVLLPSIKADLVVSDTVLGAVTTAFTVSYVAFGIPLARLADRFSRKNVITVALTTWSLMTALCGVAQNFIQLAIARVLVGVGEAGATPPAHSLIADYFPLSRRSKAIALYSIGAPIGLMVGFVFASWVAEQYSWRIAFLSLGIPGLLLAVVVLLKLVEPQRGQSDGQQAQADEVPSFVVVIAELLKSPAFRHLCFATGLYTVVYLAVIGWLPSYFVRSFDMPISQVGLWLAFSLGMPQIIGMLCSGILTDRWVLRDLRWYGWIPALAMGLSTPLFFIVFLTDNAWVACGALFPAFMIGVFQGPASFAAVQSLASIRMRAMAVAIFLLVTNLVGGTLGPLVTGLLSDRLVQEYGSDSLRYALLAICIVFGFWACLHYALAARTVGREISEKRQVQ